MSWADGGVPISVSSRTGAKTSGLFTGESVVSRGFGLAVLVAAAASAARTWLVLSPAAPDLAVSGPPGDLAAALAIILTVLGGLFPLPLGQKIHLSLGSAAIFGTLLAFPAYEALPLAFTGTLVAQLVRRHRGYRLTPSTILFNQAQYLVTWSLAAAVYVRTRADLLAHPGLAWVPVAAAGTVYILVNTWVVTTWAALRRRGWTWDLWLRALREGGLGFAASLMLGAAVARLAATRPALMLPLGLAVVLLYWLLSRKSGIQFRRTSTSLSAVIEFAERLSPFMAEHSERVSWWAERLARHLGMPEDEVEAVATAAKLHDLGKILLWHAIEEKPARLTPEERAMVQQHPAVGAEVIRHLSGLDAVARYVRYHHERADGKGYPESLSGDEIPLGARILAVAESFDAMLTPHPYRPALAPQEALAQIAAEAGTQFDPRVASALVALAQWETRDRRVERPVHRAGALALAGAGGAMIPAGSAAGRMLGDAIEEFLARDVSESPQPQALGGTAPPGLFHQLVAAQEAERRRIACELHDEIGQALTSLKLTLEVIPRLPAQKVGPHLRDAQKTLTELMTRVHDLSLDLRPAMLDDLGLLPALLCHFERYTSQAGVQVAFQHTGLDRRFSPAIETGAYRIVQEALTNVARHAGAREATVRVWADQGTLWVQIEDRGKGFDLQGVEAPGAAGGLAGMRERALLLRGHLEVESAPGAGTRVTAELPLDTVGKEGKILR